MGDNRSLKIKQEEEKIITWSNSDSGRHGNNAIADNAHLSSKQEIKAPTNQAPIIVALVLSGTNSQPNLPTFPVNS